MPVVVVTAPAGYGKTTALRQLVDGDERRVIWLHLHRYDDDLVTLLRLLAAAFAAHTPCDALLAAVCEPRPRPARVLPLLEEAMGAVGEPFVLVVDEVDTIRDGPASELLGHVLDMLPEGTQAYLAGRRNPTVHLARRIAEGRAVVVTTAVLAFTPAESVELLTQCAPGMDHAIADLLAEQLDGWPVGLQVAAVTFRTEAAGGALTADDALASGRRHLARYVHEELLDKVGPTDYRFLLRSAVLEHLSGDALDALLDEEATAGRLAGLERAGLLVLSPHVGSGIRRYHPVFRSVLLDELRSADAKELEQLYRRAIRWHLDRGEGKLAVAQALELSDRGIAAEVVFAVLPSTLLRGETATMAKWLSWFDAKEARSNPLLALAEAWQALMLDRPADLERWLLVAENLSHEGPCPDGTASIELACAALRMVAGVGGVVATLEHATTVYDAGPDACPWWGASAQIRALCRYLAGVVADAREALEPAEFDTRVSPLNHALVLAHLGIAALRRGDRSEGLHLISRCSQEMESLSVLDFPMMVVAVSAQSYAAAVRGDVVRSKLLASHTEDLLRMLWNTLDRGHVVARLSLAEAALARRDVGDATLQLTEADRRLRSEADALTLHEWADEVRTRIDALRARPGSCELTRAERRVLEQLATHRSLSEIGDHLYVSRNTVKSHTLAIYRKLDAPGRSQAVEAGVALGLLPALENAMELQRQAHETPDPQFTHPG
jgi:LuxR family maltose regulon positive regulatory protein